MACQSTTGAVLGRWWNVGQAVKVGLFLRLTGFTCTGSLELVAFNLLGEIAIISQKKRMVITVLVFSGGEAGKTVNVKLL